MAITQAITTSFKVELLKAVHNFSSGGHAFKIALYQSTSNLSAATTGFGNSTSTNEVSGTGYSSGGVALTNVTPVASSTTAIADWSNDPTWSTSTITANGALIYNDTVTASAPTVADASVMTLAFGSDKISTAGDFVIQFPAADISNAIIRIT